MRDIYRQHEYMSFGQLREYFKSLRTKQRMIFGLPLLFAIAGLCFTLVTVEGIMVSFLYSGSADGAGNIISNYFLSNLMWVVFIFSIPWLPIGTLKHRFVAPIIMAVFTGFAALMGGGCTFLCLLMTLYLMFASVVMHPITAQIMFMRELPDFPFDERVEIERKREALAHTYSEKSNTSRNVIRQVKRENYDETKTEKLLSDLPKKNIQPRNEWQDKFDDLDMKYTDQLVGENEGKKEKEVFFDDPEAVFKDIDKQVDNNVERRSIMTEAGTDGFDKDFDTRKRAMMADRRMRIKDAVNKPPKQQAPDSLPKLETSADMEE